MDLRRSEKSKIYFISLFLPFTYTLILIIWWISIYTRGLIDDFENNLFTLLYPLLSIYGSIAGFFIAKTWGGFKSVLGKAIIFLSLGLFFQFFGQASYAYYIYIDGIDVPYPSLGDIGYFGSIIFYSIGVLLLGKSTNPKIFLKSYFAKFLSLIIPFIIISLSYFFFLKGYEFDWSNPLIIFLDFGYPLGQAIYVSFAILVYILSRKKIGGFLKKPAVYLIIALLWQYLCDYIFLYQAYHGIWNVGGFNDFMYAISYFFMTFSLLSIGKALKNIRDN